MKLASVHDIPYASNLYNVSAQELAAYRKARGLQDAEKREQNKHQPNAIHRQITYNVCKYPRRKLF